MPVYASDIVTRARNNLSDNTSQARFTDASMLLWTSDVVQEMTRRLLFPEYRLTFSSVANIQEYANMPEVLRTLRVYVAGQLIVPTDLPTLEGTQIQLYDQSGNGGAPAVGSGGPPGNVGTASPAWTTQMAENYPILSELGNPAPDAVPWFTGSRPRYYWRAGVFGLVPAPAGVYTVCIDGVFNPATITALATQLVVPSFFLRAAAWEVASSALFSDRDSPSGGIQASEIAHGKYEALMGELRGWKRRYNGPSPRGPKMLTQRSFYTRSARRNYGGGSYGGDD